MSHKSAQESGLPQAQKGIIPNKPFPTLRARKSRINGRLSLHIATERRVQEALLQDFVTAAH